MNPIEAPAEKGRRYSHRWEGAAVACALVLWMVAGIASVAGARALVMLPVQDRTGGTAEVALLDEVIREELGRKGYFLPSREETRQAQRRFRVRDSERVSLQRLLQFGDALDAGAILLVTLHQIGTEDVPFISISSQLLWKEQPDLGWAGFQAKSGLSADTLMPSGTMEGLDSILKAAARGLVDDFESPSRPSSHKRRPVASSFLRSPLSAARLGRVAVVPFDATVEQTPELASDLITNLARVVLIRRGVRVTATNRVNDVLEEQEIPTIGGVDRPTRRDLRSDLEADTIFTGRVEGFERLGVGEEAEWRIAVSARLVDAANGTILWMGSVEQRGSDYQTLFGQGHIYDPGGLAEALMESLAADLFIADQAAGSGQGVLPAVLRGRALSRRPAALNVPQQPSAPEPGGLRRPANPQPAAPSPPAAEKAPERVDTGSSSGLERQRPAGTAAAPAESATKTKPAPPMRRRTPKTQTSNSVPSGGGSGQQDLASLKQGSKGETDSAKQGLQKRQSGGGQPVPNASPEGTVTSTDSVKQRSALKRRSSQSRTFGSKPGRKRLNPRPPSATRKGTGADSAAEPAPPKGEPDKTEEKQGAPAKTFRGLRPRQVSHEKERAPASRASSPIRAARQEPVVPRVAKTAQENRLAERLALKSTDADPLHPPATAPQRASSPLAGETDGWLPGVVAQVNGEPIMVQDLERKLEDLHRAGAAGISRARFDTEQFIRSVIDDFLLAQEARAEGLLEEEAIQGRFKQVREKLLLELIEREMILNKAEPTVEEVHKAFEEKYRRVSLRILTVDERADAEAFLKRIKKGEDMVALASEHSVDQYAKEGGIVEDIPIVDLSVAVATLAETVGAGQLGGPVPTELGWAVVKIEKVEEADPETYGKIEESLRNLVKYEKAKGLRAELSKKARKGHPVEIIEPIRASIVPLKSERQKLIPEVSEPEAVVVRIGKQGIITSGDYGRALRARWKFVRNVEAAKAAAPIVLSGLIEQALLVEEALSQGLDKRPEVVEALRTWEVDFLADEYKRRLFQRGFEVTQDETLAYYNANKDEFKRPPRMHLGQVTVATEEEAKQVARMLRDGADIAFVAEQHSIDRFAKTGGVKGWVVPNPDISKLDARIAEAKAGDVIEAGGGLLGEHVVLIVTAREEQAPVRFQEVSRQIYDRLYTEKAREKRDSILKRLRDRSEIRINNALVESLQLSGTNEKAE